MNYLCKISYIEHQNQCDQCHVNIENITKNKMNAYVQTAAMGAV